MTDQRLIILAWCSFVLALTMWRHMVLAMRCGSVWDVAMSVAGFVAGAIPMAALAYRFMG